MLASTRLLIIGALFFAVGMALFYWGATSDLIVSSTGDAAEPMRRIGQVSGAVAGIGSVVFALGVIQRLRGR